MEGTIREMFFLFFDVETTGTDRDSRLVQLAYALYDDAVEIAFWSGLIKPDGFDIPATATAIHGISTDRAKEQGILLSDALSRILSIVQQADLLVAHNIIFDSDVLINECKRKGIDFSLLSSSKKICTMHESTDFCKLPGLGCYGYKWPRLNELHTILFGYPFDNAHDAMSDVRACAACYFELRKRGVIK